MSGRTKILARSAPVVSRSSSATWNSADTSPSAVARSAWRWSRRRRAARGSRRSPGLPGRPCAGVLVRVLVLPCPTDAVGPVRDARDLGHTERHHHDRVPEEFVDAGTSHLAQHPRDLALARVRSVAAAPGSEPGRDPDPPQPRHHVRPGGYLPQFGVGQRLRPVRLAGAAGSADHGHVRVEREAVAGRGEQPPQVGVVRVRVERNTEGLVIRVRYSSVVGAAVMRTPGRGADSAADAPP